MCLAKNGTAVCHFQGLNGQQHFIQLPFSIFINIERITHPI